MSSRLLKDLLTLAENIEEHWGEGCLFCGYRNHRQSCSLNNLIVRTKKELNTMSEEFNKRVEDNEVIFENSEARWIFSQGLPPHIDDYQVAIQVVDKKIRVPVMIVMSGREFRSMLRDMGIKTLTDPRDRI